MWKLREFRGTSAHFSRHFQTSETVHYAFFMHSAPLTRPADMCGRWENFVVHLRTFRRILKQVKQCIMPFMPSATLTRPAEFFKCSNACRHVQWDVH